MPAATFADGSTPDPFATLLAGAATCVAPQAAGMLFTNDKPGTPQPLRWDTSKPIPVWTDLGVFTCSFDGTTPFITNERADELVAFGLNQWSRLPASTPRARVVGDISKLPSIGTDVTAKNFTKVWGAFNGGGMHEFGHAFNLSHSQVNGPLAYFSHPGPSEYFPGVPGCVAPVHAPGSGGNESANRGTDTACAATPIVAQGGVPTRANLVFNAYRDGVQYAPVTDGSLTDLSRDGSRAAGQYGPPEFVWNARTDIEVLSIPPSCDWLTGELLDPCANWDHARIDSTYGQIPVGLFDMNDAGTGMTDRKGVTYLNVLEGAMWVDGLGWLKLGQFFQRQGVAEAYRLGMDSPITLNGAGNEMVGGLASVPMNRHVDMKRVFACQGGQSGQVSFPDGAVSAVSAGAKLGRCEHLKG